eukprot:271298-Pelagomonas_calceolata.AAC.2
MQPVNCLSAANGKDAFSVRGCQGMRVQQYKRKRFPVSARAEYAGSLKHRVQVPLFRSIGPTPGLKIELRAKTELRASNSAQG